MKRTIKNRSPHQRRCGISDKNGYAKMGTAALRALHSEKPWNPADSITLTALEARLAEIDAHTRRTLC